MRAVGACTIVSADHLPLSRVLAESLARHHPELELHVLVIDEPLDHLGVEDTVAWRFSHSVAQVAMGLKPTLMEHLLDGGHEAVLYLDADMLVLDRLDPLLDPLGDGAAVITPHLLAPADAERELNILLSGVYNTGVVGASGSAAGRAFVANWRERLETHCRFDLARGLYYDQRWVDLAPSQHPGLRVLRDPTVNVGHWALPDRRLEMSGATLLVEGRACRLFHFSGFKPWNRDQVTSHSSRLSREDLGDAWSVFEDYARMLDEAGLATAPHVPYPYGRFDDGVAIPDVARVAWSRGEHGRFADPFASGPGSFQEWLTEAVEGQSRRGPRITRLWHFLHGLDPALQADYPDHLSADRGRFADWIRQEGAARHGIDRSFTEPPQRGLRAALRRS